MEHIECTPLTPPMAAPLAKRGTLALMVAIAFAAAAGCGESSDLSPDQDEQAGSGGTSSGGSRGANAEQGGQGGAAPSEPLGSLGCGSSAAPQSGQFSIEVDGVSRDYVLDVPDDYDPTRPYSLVFTWHWLGGNYQEVVNGSWASDGPYYGLEEQAGGSAIFVAPNGTLEYFNGALQRGWWNTDGADFALTRALLAHLESELCIDEDRIFSVGFSFGGMFSYALGCAMPDVFRAIAPMSGALIGGCDQSDRSPVAMWGAHGIDDGVVNIASGRAARDEFLSRSGCGGTTTPVEPSPCVRYEGCSSEAPVEWCEWSGDHIPPSFAAEGIWNFFEAL